MGSRRTFAEVEAYARKHERDYTLAMVCRVLKHHMGQPEIADELYGLMNSSEPLIERPIRENLIK